MKVVKISEEDINKLIEEGKITVEEMINSVDEVFRFYADGTAKNTAKKVEQNKEGGEYFVHIEQSAEIPGYSLYKVIHETKPDGKTHKDITITLTTTQERFKIAAGDYIINSRTGIAGALAAKYLTYNPKVIAIMGAGNVPEQFVLAANFLFKNLEEIRFATRSPESRERFRRFLEDNTDDLIISAYDIYNREDRRKLLSNADILFEAAPLEERGRITYDEIKLMNSGAHISSMTGDGKQDNFEERVLKESAIVVDIESGARNSGQLKNAKSTIKIIGTIGEASKGKLNQYKSRLTFYDSTGMGISDLAVAKLIADRYLN